MDTEIRLKEYTCRGQAMIEFMIGLLVVVLLVSGLVQLITIYDLHSEMLGEARGEAGERAINIISLADTPDFIVDWNPGPDGLRHTADDEPETMSAARFQATITEKTAASPEQWALLDDVVNNGPTAFRGSVAPMAHFGLVSEEIEEDVALTDPVIRNWIYGKDDITIKTTVWMPKLGGCY